MTEACHAHLGTVHHYPPCGRLSLEGWDDVAPVTERFFGITGKSPRVAPGRGGGDSAAPSGSPYGQEEYAPGHGPGVATSGSTSVFVSKSRKPRRR